MREKRVSRNNCELILSYNVPADHEYANGVGVDTPCGEVSTREVIVIVPALLELQRSGGFLNGVWGPVSPVCDGTAPHWLVSLYHPPRVGRRCEARTNQRF